MCFTWVVKNWLCMSNFRDHCSNQEIKSFYFFDIGEICKTSRFLHFKTQLERKIMNEKPKLMYATLLLSKWLNDYFILGGSLMKNVVNYQNCGHFDFSHFIYFFFIYISFDIDILQFSGNWFFVFISIHSLYKCKQVKQFLKTTEIHPWG